ncbi:MAG: hypothetical protein JW709_09945 [Sedimentisphaerales bacterium]|nr:hypothetical protein [Sedimentisphaerales bacterium]
MAEFNTLTQPEGLTEENNAWVLYEQAIKAYVPMSEALDTLDGEMTEERMADPNDPYWGLVAEWAQQNASALDLFRQATQRPLFWREYKVEKPGQGLNEAFGEYMDFLKLMRDISRLVRLKIDLLIHSHHYEDAAELSLVLIRFSVHMVQHKPPLISYLVGISVSSGGISCFNDILSQYDFTSRQLQEYKDILNTMSNHINYSIKTERLFALDLVQYIYGPGDWAKPNPVRWKKHSDFTINKPVSVIEWIRYGVDVCRYAFYSLLQADRQDALDKVHQVFDRWQVLENNTPHDLMQNCPDLFEPNELSSSYAVLAGVLPYQDILLKGAMFVYGFRTQLEALITVLALKKYKCDIGNYPSDLQTLKRDGYLPYLPRDPFSKDILIYRKEKNDFRLYSFSWDCDDDGGIQKPGDIYGVMHEDGGDRVFWPVQK